MATEIRPINLADVARVAPVVRVALVVPEDPVESAVRAALVVPEDRVAAGGVGGAGRPGGAGGAGGVGGAGRPGGLAVRAALVAPENPAGLWRWTPAVPAALERELVRRRRTRARPSTRPAGGRLRTKSVIAAHRPDQVPLLAAEEDLAAGAETTREPAAAEAAIAWAAADTAAWRWRWIQSRRRGGGIQRAAAVAEDAAVAAEDAAAAAEDAEINELRWRKL